jgi:hypothetical protein
VGLSVRAQAIRAHAGGREAEGQEKNIWHGVPSGRTDRSMAPIGRTIGAGARRFDRRIFVCIFVFGNSSRKGMEYGTTYHSLIHITSNIWCQLEELNIR